MMKLTRHPEGPRSPNSGIALSRSTRRTTCDLYLVVPIEDNKTSQVCNCTPTCTPCFFISLTAPLPPSPLSLPRSSFSRTGPAHVQEREREKERVLLGPGRRKRRNKRGQDLSREGNKSSGAPSETSPACVTGRLDELVRRGWARRPEDNGS